MPHDLEAEAALDQAMLPELRRLQAEAEAMQAGLPWVKNEPGGEKPPVLTHLLLTRKGSDEYSVGEWNETHGWDVYEIDYYLADEDVTHYMIIVPPAAGEGAG